MTKLSQLTWDGENISFAITSPAYKEKVKRTKTIPQKSCS
jgi:hypothetical protein